MKPIFETYLKSPKSFNQFLNECKKAVNKLFSRQIETNYDFWSYIVPDTKLTAWQYLNEFQSVCININGEILEAEFGNNIYCDFAANLYNSTLTDLK